MTQDQQPSASPRLSPASNGRWLLLGLNRLRDRWQDRSLTVLLVLQVMIIFGLVPVAAEGFPLSQGLSALVLLLVMSLSIFVARGRWTLTIGILLFISNALAAVLREASRGIAADIAFNLIALATFAGLSAVVAAAVFRPGRFTGHRIRGAVVLYLNLGLLFAFLHRIIADVFPGAYTNIPNPHSEAAFRAALDYYSFATLTSVGYGDIVPVAPLARSLSTLEAAIGQLLPTLLIGRVVSLSLREDTVPEPEP